ncbi:MAG: sulfatase-like hydrolase/transferase [Planctomycetota bacterium]
MQSQACRRVVWSRSFIAALLSLLTAVSPGVADPVASPGNVVIVVLDDVSVDELSVYAGYPLAEACGNQDQCVHPIAGCNTCSCPSFPAFPDTPFITSLANEGVIFKNAYSNPTCSPTRTTIQTGRYAFRTGVGLPGDGFGPREQTIPEVLRSIAPQPSPSYSSAAIGKWHMSTEKQFDACGPVLFGGYDYFIGTETNIGDYCSWRKTRASRGVPDCITDDRLAYATTDNVDDAIRWVCGLDSCGDGLCAGGETGEGCPADCVLQNQCNNDRQCTGQENFISCPGDCTAAPVCGNGVCEAGERYCSMCPEQDDCVAEMTPLCSNPRANWFLSLAFNAPHGPTEVPCAGVNNCVPLVVPPPPEEVGTRGICRRVQAYAGDTEGRTSVRRVLEIVDCELSRFYAAMPQDMRDNTTFIILGDNGSADTRWNAGHGKGSVYDAGSRVPLIVSGKNVINTSGVTRVAASLVNTTDIFSTALELMGVDVPAALPGVALDSTSLVPILDNPYFADTLRDTAYVEAFNNNCTGDWKRAIRDYQYKLVQTCPACTDGTCCFVGTELCTEEWYDVTDVLECTNLETNRPPEPELTTLLNAVAALRAKLPEDVLCTATPDPNNPTNACQGCTDEADCPTELTCHTTTSHECCDPAEFITVQWIGPPAVPGPQAGVDYSVYSVIEDGVCMPPDVVLRTTNKGTFQVTEYRIGRANGNNAIPIGAVTTAWIPGQATNINVMIGNSGTGLKVADVATVDIDAQEPGITYSGARLELAGSLTDRAEVSPVGTMGGRISGDVAGTVKHVNAYAIGEAAQDDGELKFAGLAPGAIVELASHPLGSTLRVTGPVPSDAEIRVMDSSGFVGPVIIEAEFNGKLCAAGLVNTTNTWTATVPPNMDVLFGVNGQLCNNSSSQGCSTECVTPCTTPLDLPAAEIPAIAKNRYVSFIVPSGAADSQLVVSLDSLPPDFSAHEGETRFVNYVRDSSGNIVIDCPDSAVLQTTFKCAKLGCSPEPENPPNWSARCGTSNLHVTGPEIVPSSSYSLEARKPITAGSNSACRSLKLPVSTGLWGNVDNDPQLNVLDLAATVDKVKDLWIGTLPKPRTQLQGDTPDPLANVNVLDIASVVDALKSIPYRYPGPQDCP